MKIEEINEFLLPYVREQLDGSTHVGFDVRRQFTFEPHKVNYHNKAGKEELANCLIYQALKFSQHFLNYAWLLRDNKIGLPILEESIPDNNKVVPIRGEK